MSTINFPIMYINDPEKGRPIFNGKMYFGVPDLDPEIAGNQKQVYYIQENGDLVAASQPILLSAGGNPTYNGDAVTLSITGEYSTKVLNKLGAQEYYIARTDSSGTSGSVITYAEDSQTLIAGQLVVDFTGITVSVANIYVGKNSGDRGKLFEGDDYTVTGGSQITLTNSFSAGTKLIAASSELVARSETSEAYEVSTYAELTSLAIVFPEGKKITIRERNNASFIFSIGGTPNDSYILDAGNGNTAVLSVDSMTDIVSFGAIDGVASGIDNSININYSINIMGRLIAPVGDFEIHNSILIPITTYGYVWEGEGMEQTIFRAVGMAGKNGIELADNRYGPRIQMRDFQVIGDCDTALDMDLASTGIISEIQMCEWRNMRLTSTGDAMKCNKHFSCAWYNVHTETTTDGHGLNIQGGNSTVLVNCYAHNIAGVGKAGYKILASATMMGCNGLDSGDYWGIFGGTIAEDGINAIYRINIIGGNSEDFDSSAILTRFTGSMTTDNWNSLAKATGTFDNYIQMNCSNSTFTRNGGSWVSKGATQNDAEQIVTPNGQRYIEVNDESNNTPGYLRGGATYRAATKFFEDTEFQVTATKMASIDPERNYGFNSEIPVISVDTSNIVVTGITKVITENTVATNVDSATGFVVGQSLYIMVNDANTTIRHLAVGSGRFNLTGGVNISASQGDVFEFVTFDGVEWNQVKS